MIMERLLLLSFLHCISVRPYMNSRTAKVKKFYSSFASLSLRWRIRFRTLTNKLHEAESLRSSVTQIIPRIMESKKNHNRVQMTTYFVSIPSQMNLLHTLPLCSLTFCGHMSDSVRHMFCEYYGRSGVRRQTVPMCHSSLPLCSGIKKTFVLILWLNLNRFSGI
jgi:hypothetical protein